MTLVEALKKEGEDFTLKMVFSVFTEKDTPQNHNQGAGATTSLSNKLPHPIMLFF